MDYVRGSKLAEDALRPEWSLHANNARGTDGDIAGLYYHGILVSVWNMGLNEFSHRLDGVQPVAKIEDMMRQLWKNYQQRRDREQAIFLRDMEEKKAREQAAVQAALDKL